MRLTRYGQIHFSEWPGNDMNKYYYQDNKINFGEYPAVSIYDTGSMYGAQVFEMTRSFNKKHFKLREHLERLYLGIKILRIPIKETINEMEEICEDVSNKNNKIFEKNDEHRLLIQVSSGPLSIYPGYGKCSVIIDDFPLRWTVQGMGKLFDIGINAIVPSQRTVPYYLIDPRIKNRCRLHYYMANIEISNHKGNNNWALLLDDNHFISEGTGANFFCIKNGKLYTPKPYNILRGISREYIKELAVNNVVEEDLTILDAIESDEAFFTATPFCILPIVKINGIKIGNGKSGHYTNELLKLWGDHVEVDIVKQIKSWDKGYIGSSPYQFKKR